MGWITLKKQYDNTTLTDTTENPQQTIHIKQSDEDDQAKQPLTDNNCPRQQLISLNLIEQDQGKEQEKDHSTLTTETDQNISIQTILHELKSIKETIVHLGVKVDISNKNLATNSMKT